MMKKNIKNNYEEGNKLESLGQRAKNKNVIEHPISYKTIESEFMSQMLLYFNYFVSPIKL